MKKSTILGFIIFVLAACNVFLLYTNAQWQNQINDLATQNYEQETAALTAGDIISQNAKVIHPQVNLPDSGLALLVFFSIQSCSSCLEYEVPNFNTFYNRFPEHAQAYLVTGGKPFLERYGAEFESTIISPSDSVFNVDLQIGNPVGVVVDAGGTIQSVYLSDVGKQTKSEHFYKRMVGLFSSLN